MASVALIVALTLASGNMGKPLYPDRTRWDISGRKMRIGSRMRAALPGRRKGKAGPIYSGGVFFFVKTKPRAPTSHRAEMAYQGAYAIWAYRCQFAHF